MSTARAAAPGRQTASGPSAPVSMCWGWTTGGELPWEAAPQIAAAYDEARRQYEYIALLANSIGAYFAMLALQDQAPDRALFVSPVLDMERLILDMMSWAGVSEQALREQGEIPTNFGETLSWKYLCYVREHPIAWQVPTEILYAGGDHLVSRQSVERFAAEHGRRAHRPGGRRALVPHRGTDGLTG